VQLLYRKVHVEEQELNKEADELKAALRKAREAVRKQVGMNSKDKSALEAFQKGPKQAFEELRDRAKIAAAAEQTGDADGAPDGVVADEVAADDAAADDVATEVAISEGGAGVTA